jgi:hypothetical protein
LVSYCVSHSSQTDLDAVDAAVALVDQGEVVDDPLAMGMPLGA